jgi:hypothetical protein
MNKFNVVLSFRQPKSKFEVKEYDGRTYRVCPVTLMREGVWRCNEGAVYYPAEEMRLFCEAWNNKPIVKDHPQDDQGNFIVADTIEVLEKQKLGFLLNTRFENGAQKADAWIDEKRAEQIWPELLQSIDSGTPMEVSSGLVSTCEIAEGRHGGKRYEYIAREHRPDHLAILSSTRGACSLADGAGLLVAQSFEADDIPQKMMEIAVERLDIMLANQLTHNRIRSLLSTELESMARTDAQSKGVSPDYIWIEDVVGRKAIVGWGGKMYEVPFRQSSEGVTLSAAPPYREVVRVTQYRLVDGTVIGNEKSTDVSPEDTSVKKSEMITFLIANQVFEEADRSVLETFSEEKLSKMTEKLAPAEKKTLANEEAKPKFDYKSFMAAAPIEFQRSVARSMKLMNEQVAADVAEVVRLSDGAYSEDECKSMDPDVLGKLRKTLANAAAKNTKPAETESDVWDGTDYSGADFFGARLLANSSPSEADDAPLGATPSTFVAKR